MVKRNRNTPEKLWLRVSIKSSTECWEWQGCKNTDGYGSISISGKIVKTHRLAFALSGGEITREKPHVLHHCDNPACCNPAHLFAGSHKDNMQDMAQKMRCHREGKNNGRAKITAKEVIEIRDLCEAKVFSQRDIAKIYGVGKSTVNYIHTQTTWRCVPVHAA